MIDNIQSAIDAGRALGGPELIEPDGQKAPLVVIPAGHRAEILKLSEVEQWLHAPIRKKGAFAFGDLDSFIRYFNEQKNEDSRIFSNVTDTGASFEGIINFHGAEPDFNDHKCTHTLTPTLEWTVWRENNKAQKTQTAFATFLEEHEDMFVDPKGADLRELIQTLEGKSHVNIAQAVKLQTGAIKLTYNEDVELKGQIASQTGDILVPTMLKVSIAPFVGTARYEMEARLRYRIDNRKIVFWYETVAPHLVVRAIASDMLNVIKKQTGLEPFKTA